MLSSASDRYLSRRARKDTGAATAMIGQRNIARAGRRNGFANRGNDGVIDLPCDRVEGLVRISKWKRLFWQQTRYIATRAGCESRLHKNTLTSVAGHRSGRLRITEVLQGDRRMALEIDELSTMDATAQAELVRRRELTPLALVDAAIARLERVNPTLNAVITPLFEEARAAAVSPDLPDGPFRGVPFLLKDIGAMQKGQPYYMGNRALRDAGYRSPDDTSLGGEVSRSRVYHARKEQFAGIWHANHDATACVWCHPQSLGLGSIHQWLIRRILRGGSCGTVPVAHANDGAG